MKIKNKKIYEYPIFIPLILISIMYFKVNKYINLEINEFEILSYLFLTIAIFLMLNILTIEKDYSNNKLIIRKIGLLFNEVKSFDLNDIKDLEVNNKKFSLFKKSELRIIQKNSINKFSFFQKINFDKNDIL